MTKSYNFLIIGVGSIGKKYIDIINKNYNYPNITCLRRTSKKFQTTKNLRIYRNFSQIYNQTFDIVIISSPANLHFKDFERSIFLSKNFIIEKPISTNLIQAKKIISLTKKNKLNVLVGYNLIFDEKIQYLRKIIKKNKRSIQHVNIECQSFLPNWRKETDYKRSVSASKKLGGGVLLELSHEISYILYLFGEIKQIIGITKNTKNLSIDVEDFVEIIALTKNDTIIRCHLNYNSAMIVRKCEINIFKKFISLDFVRKKISIKNNNKVNVKNFRDNLDMTYERQISYLLKKPKKNNLNNFNSLENAFSTLNIINLIKNNKYNKIIK